jgi:DNA-binding response OmpR family regulator
LATCDKRRHIFVINDTPAILDLFTALLEDEGYRVTTDTFNAVAAGDKKDEIGRMRPDLVILDFMIGGEGLGWQLLQLLKMDRATRDIPVIICTAAVRQVEELQSHLDRMGIAVVLKPFDIDRLLAVIATVLTPGQGNTAGHGIEESPGSGR